MVVVVLVVSSSWRCHHPFGPVLLDGVEVVDAFWLLVMIVDLIAEIEEI